MLNCAEQDVSSHGGWVSGWSYFTQWRVLVLIAVEESWAGPCSFLEAARFPVDLPQVDTAQFLSPISWPPMPSGPGHGTSMLVFWVELVGLHVRGVA